MNTPNIPRWLIITAAAATTFATVKPSGAKAQNPTKVIEAERATTANPPFVDAQLVEQNARERAEAILQKTFDPNVPREKAEAALKRQRKSLTGSIRTAAEAVRDAKGDEAKDEAKKNLSNILGEYFDLDTKRREDELAQIESRLTKLREQLDRRRSKKQEILDLQMKVALNEADGLGFYENTSTSTSSLNQAWGRTGSPFGVSVNWSDLDAAGRTDGAQPFVAPRPGEAPTPPRAGALPRVPAPPLPPSAPPVAAPAGAPGT